ncbi:MAG: hypothetical protein C4341_09280 [Armatimonadota bacterium]
MRVEARSLAAFGVAACVSWGFLGWQGAVGSCLGGMFSVGSLWLTKRMAFADPQMASSRMLLALIIKVPAAATVIFFTNFLGAGALIGFLVGFALVYCALLWGTVRENRAPKTCDEDI